LQDKSWISFYRETTPLSTQVWLGSVGASAVPVGAVAPELIHRLNVLSSDELDQFSEEFPDFTSIADVENWLARHKPNGHDAPPSPSA